MPADYSINYIFEIDDILCKYCDIDMLNNRNENFVKYDN